MEQDKTGEVAGKQNGDKPLPRGLEQVSHLFVSNAHPDIPPAPDALDTGRPEQPLTPRGDGALQVVMRRFVAREQLASLLQRQGGAIEEGMRVIDASVPCDACGPIELLAMDAARQLAIIDLEDSPNDGLLLRGIGHFDWITRNLGIVRRMYQSFSIDFSIEPRLVLVAPDFSAALKNAARYITSPRIHCLKYQSVGLSEGTGVFFEHASGRRQ